MPCVSWHDGFRATHEGMARIMSINGLCSTPVPVQCNSPLSEEQYAH